MTIRAGALLALLLCAGCDAELIVHAILEDGGSTGNDAGFDAGRVDAGEVDAGEVDAGELDAGEVDAGELDAGDVDAGEADAGEVDAGEVDAGEIDAGAPDAGAEPTCDDHATNGDETDQDCGGGCAPCAAGLACEGDQDCRSYACVADRCVAESEAHPRLWIQRRDLARLRSLASAENPVYSSGIATFVERGRRLMDSPPPGEAGNQIPDADNGSSEYTPIVTEEWAQLFAFLSLVSPDPAIRAEAAERARRLLLHVVNAANAGGDSHLPYRSPSFPLGSRAANHAEAFALTADWIHDTLSPEERIAVREALLRWARVVETQAPAPFAASETRRNDPLLLDLGDPARERLRGALDANYLQRLRLLGLFGLAVDADDDSSPLATEPGALRTLLGRALGVWLYATDRALRTDGAGGFPADGFEAFQRNIGRPAQLLLALSSAGYATDEGVALHGEQVRAAHHPFWSLAPRAYLHSLPFEPARVNGSPTFQPSTFGDTRSYGAGDPLQAFGALGVLAANAHDDALANTVRWTIVNARPPASRFLSRLAETEGVTSAILAFLLFPPGTVDAPDPRPAEPRTFVAPAVGRAITRSAWDADARLVSFRLGWGVLTRQHGDGGLFDFHRKGEWLTKERSGTGTFGSASDFKNALAIQCDLSGVDDGETLFRVNRGSQFVHSSGGQPPPIATSTGAGWAFFGGDAAKLYQYDDGQRFSDDVRRAARSIFWVQPDHLVVYDRVETRAAGRLKRFWLTLPGPATRAGARVSATTPGGQQLFVTTLLPVQDAVDTAVVVDDPTIVEQSATYAFTSEDPMDVPWSFPDAPVVHGTRRLRVEAIGGPSRTTFLHVLEGADAGASAADLERVGDATGALEGAAASTWVVLFAGSPAPAPSAVVRVPGPGARVWISGLAPGSTVGLTRVADGAGEHLTFTSPGDRTADAGGVIAFQ